MARHAVCEGNPRKRVGWVVLLFCSILIIGVEFVRCRQQDVQDFVAIAVHLVQDVVRTENFGRENDDQRSTRSTTKQTLILIANSQVKFDGVSMQIVRNASAIMCCEGNFRFRYSFRFSQWTIRKLVPCFGCIFLWCVENAQHWLTSEDIFEHFRFRRSALLHLTCSLHPG